MSPNPEQIEFARILQRRAAGSLVVCQKLIDDAGIDDSIIGFHAQQTVEKSLKVMLVLTGIELPRTHDLEVLVSKIRESGVKTPKELNDTEWLTPWAASLRYDVPSALDRAAALALAESAAAWADALIEDPPASDST